jgi:hypothetical protein
MNCGKRIRLSKLDNIDFYIDIIVPISYEDLTPVLVVDRYKNYRTWAVKRRYKETKTQLLESLKNYGFSNKDCKTAIKYFNIKHLI